MGTRGLLAAAAAALLALGACSSGDEGGNSLLEVASSVRSGEASLRFGPPPTTEIALSDAQINALPRPVLIVEIPKLRSEAGFELIARNRDVLTWQSGDRKQVLTRNGQLAGTIGFGNDLVSATTPEVRSGARQVTRTQYRRVGDADVVATRYDCTLGLGGQETVRVTGRVFPATLIVEECVDPAGAAAPFSNRYWVDGSGTIRQSEQYVSPGLGAVTIRDVHR